MYGRDLAAFHDAYAAELGGHGGRQLVRELEEAGLRRGRVLDLGCGSGAATEVLVGAGYTVTGVDVSEDMLRLARRRAPAATYVRSALHDVELPTGLTGIAAIGEVISYDTRIDLDEFLTRLRDALRPGGLLLFDVPGPGRHSLDEGPTRVFESEDALLIMRTRTSGFRLTRKVTTFTATGRGGWRREDERHDLRLYHEDDVRAGLARAGFVAIRPLERYDESPVTFAPHWPAFVAARG